MRGENVITVLDENQDAMAIIDKYVDDEIREAINGEYTLKFTCVMEEGKSQYIAVGNYCEADGQLFNIVRHTRTRSPLGAAMITVHAEQVSYELISIVYDHFVHAGTPAALLAMVLDDTGFTLGDVEPTGTISVDVKQETTAKALLLEIARLTGGELEYDGYTVHLRTRRGMERGVEFRLGKNLRGLTKDVSALSGEVVTAYQVDIVELRELPGFGELEVFELGDRVFVVDEELGIDEEQRIVQYVYSPKRRINSSVTIAAAIPGIQDQYYRLQQTAVPKDKYQYGTRIGPDVGFESVRWDNKARSVFNADIFAMQKRNGGGGWTNAVYFNAIEEEYEFVGILRASKFIGGEIQIGSAFSVNSSGHMVAVGGEFSGEISASIINGGVINGAIINGGQINGTTITGGELRSAASGRRVSVTGGNVSFYNTNDTLGMVIAAVGSQATQNLYDNGVLRGSFFHAGGVTNLTTDGNITLFPTGNLNLAGQVRVNGGEPFNTITQSGSASATLPQLEAQVNTIIQNLRRMHIYAWP